MGSPFLLIFELLIFSLISTSSRFSLKTNIKAVSATCATCATDRMIQATTPSVRAVRKRPAPSTAPYSELTAGDTWPDTGARHVAWGTYHYYTTTILLLLTLCGTVPHSLQQCSEVIEYFLFLLTPRVSTGHLTTVQTFR